MKVLLALLIQLLSLLLSVALAQCLPQYFSGLWRLVLLQSMMAAMISCLWRQPIWWLPIHLAFLPLVAVFFSFQIPAGAYLLIFLALGLIFWGTFKGDVPLFLSSPGVVEAVTALVAKERTQSFAELGAGIGSIVLPVAKAFPLLTVSAYELAPMPWSICAWRGRKLTNLKVQRLSFWSLNLAEYDVVYAFLSTAIMPALGEKISREMRPGSLFISSSFPVLAWQPESIVRVDDRRQTELYCYRIPQPRLKNAKKR